ncbi:hypothetical protein [Algivirga pacifica]|uniref:Uncharacterized protein n=1 Tax=Algivirga pacifica TaxID=1162670 RepID=A0ABP9DDC5_9BACT
MTSTTIHSRLQEVKFGLILSLLTILFGFGMGGVFGAMEDDIKGHLKAEGQAALETVYKGDEAKMKATVSKSWSYFKRAHLHGGGIGAATLGVIIVLAFTYASSIFKLVVSIALGAGGLGYSIFWMMAGLRAPGMGSTGIAKESLSWLAIPSSGMLLLGLITATIVVAISLFSSKEKA